MPCARCLSPAAVDLAGELSLLLKPVAASEPAGRGSGSSGAGRGGSARDRDRNGGGSVAASTYDAGSFARAAARALPDWEQGGRGGRAGAGGSGTSPGKPGSQGRKGAAGGGQGRGASQVRNDKGSKKAAREAEYEFSSEEAEVDTYDGETVVLDEFIREALLLELPNFPLCSEACPGIRPVASEPEAGSGESAVQVDPRLMPLGALRAKLEKSLDVSSSGTKATSAEEPAPSPAKGAESGSGAGSTTKKKRKKE
jgi:hypothetical protein